jgi:hypothetical protein
MGVFYSTVMLYQVIQRKRGCFTPQWCFIKSYRGNGGVLLHSDALSSHTEETGVFYSTVMLYQVIQRKRGCFTPQWCFIKSYRGNGGVLLHSDALSSHIEETGVFYSTVMLYEVIQWKRGILLHSIAVETGDVFLYDALWSHTEETVRGCVTPRWCSIP